MSEMRDETASALQQSVVRLEDALRGMGILQVPAKGTDLKDLLALIKQYPTSFLEVETEPPAPAQDQKWQLLSVRALVQQRAALLKLGFAKNGRLMFWSREFICE